MLTQVRALYEEGLADYEMKPAIEKAISSFSGWAGYGMRLGPHVSRAYLEVEEADF